MNSTCQACWQPPPPVQDVSTTQVPGGWTRTTQTFVRTYQGLSGAAAGSAPRVAYERERWETWAREQARAECLSAAILAARQDHCLSTSRVNVTVHNFSQQVQLLSWVGLSRRQASSNESRSWLLQALRTGGLELAARPVPSAAAAQPWESSLLRTRTRLVPASGAAHQTGASSNCSSACADVQFVQCTLDHPHAKCRAALDAGPAGNASLGNVSLSACVPRCADTEAMLAAASAQNLTLVLVLVSGADLSQRSVVNGSALSDAVCARYNNLASQAAGGKSLWLEPGQLVSAEAEPVFSTDFDMFVELATETLAGGGADSAKAAAEPRWYVVLWSVRWSVLLLAGGALLAAAGVLALLACRRHLVQETVAVSLERFGDAVGGKPGCAAQGSLRPLRSGDSVMIDGQATCLGRELRDVGRSGGGSSSAGLGGGSFASYEATWGSKKTRVSFKQYLVTRAAHGDDAAFAEVCSAFAKEVTTWRALKHPHVVECLGCTISPHMCVITASAARGPLAALLARGFEPMQHGDLLASLAHDAAAGLAYLHGRTDKTTGRAAPLLHRDVKCANIVVTLSWRARITDFGMSRTKAQTDEGATRVMTQCGTPFWTPPEIFLGRAYNERADVYSFGMSLLEMTRGTRPLWGPDPSLGPTQVGYKVSQEGARPALSDATPRAIREVIISCWAQESAQRPTMANVRDTLGALLPPCANVREGQQSWLGPRCKPGKEPTAAETGGGRAAAAVQQRGKGGRACTPPRRNRP